VKRNKEEHEIKQHEEIPYKRTVNIYHAIGTKCSKTLRQCPKLIIGRVSSVRAVPQSLY